ncbi:MAG: stage II sporulation protein M [Steroidobacteraceae bacterium]|jgi:uncharacterized membrane protein SpoIIM required for sporulation
MTALEFQTAHEGLWVELEQAIQLPERKLDPQRFLALYRTCCEHFALAEARGFPSAIIERLSIVTARAHQIVYRQSDFGIARIARVLLNRFPAMVRAHRGYVALSALLAVGPAVVLGLAVYHKPDLILSIVDGSTAAKFEKMYDPSNEVLGRLRDAGSNWMMFGFYIMNNIGIAFQCYATGVLLGVGSVYFIAMNGAFGGAIAGYVASAGFGGTFFSFVATHSAFELTAIVLCGAAGLRIGRAVLLPGRLPRAVALELAAKDTSVIVFGSAVMLVIAAAIEAFWSSAAWVTPTAKYCGAAACWILVTLFFLRRPYAD